MSFVDADLYDPFDPEGKKQKVAAVVVLKIQMKQSKEERRLNAKRSAIKKTNRTSI